MAHQLFHYTTFETVTTMMWAVSLIYFMRIEACTVIFRFMTACILTAGYQYVTFRTEHLT